MAEPRWHEGGCFCGDIRYRVRGEAVWKAGCTCQDCVRIQSAPYVVWAGFEDGNFELLCGVSTKFRSSPNVIRQFCPRCGSTLTYRKDADGRPDLADASKIIYIAVSGLDDPALYPPDEVIHYRERARWLELAGSIPRHDVLSPTMGHMQFAGIEATKPRRQHRSEDA